MITQETYPQTILDAAKEVFETMIFMEIEPSAETGALGSPGIIGTITFKGSLEGCLSFTASMECAETIARNMLAIDGESPLSREETCDAIGEVVNMVMGSVKSRLQETYHDIEVSIPSVVTGCELDNMGGEKSQITRTRICLDVTQEAEIIWIVRKTA